MATERIVVSVSSTGAVTVRKEISGIGDGAEKSAKSVDVLKGALATFVSAATIQQIASFADAGTQLSNSLKVAGLSGQTFANTQNELFAIAKANGQNVNELATIYQRLNSVQGQLGIGQKEMIEALKNIGAGFKISASSAAAQSGALQQLQQLLGGTVVQMQEVNSLVDGAFPILQAVARGTDEFGGNVGALINRLREGGYSVKAFFDGLMRGSEINRQLAESWNMSFGQALTNFRTNVIQALLEFNQLTGAFTIGAQVVNFLGNNLLVLSAILSPLAAAITILAVQTIGNLLVGAMTQAAVAIGGVISAMAKLLLFFVANPFTALIAGLALVILYFVDWQKAIVQTIKLFGQLMAIAGDFLNNDAMKKGGVQIALNAEEMGRVLAEKAKEMKAAITDGGKEAANLMRSGVAQGGAQAAGAIRGAAAAGAASAAASAQATYQALNGVPQKIKGAIQVGADYMKNEVTGEITKAGGKMQAGIEEGGSSAAKELKSGVEAGAKAGGKILYENIEQAFANNVMWLNDLYKIINNRENAANREKNANADKLSAEAEKLKAEANKLRLRFQPGGGGGGGGGGGAYDGGFAGGDTGDRGNNFGYSSRPSAANDAAANGNATTTTNKVSITNVFDPNMLVEAQTTAAGQRATINNIRANRDEIRLALGIA